MKGSFTSNKASWFIEKDAFGNVSCRHVSKEER